MLWAAHAGCPVQIVVTNLQFRQSQPEYSVCPSKEYVQNQHVLYMPILYSHGNNKCWLFFQVTLSFCRFCERYLQPPSQWVAASLESRELMALCLKRLGRALTKVKLVDANFVWTEPHSKRLKVKLTVQAEVRTAILQQTFLVEYVVHNQMCDDCRRVEAKDTWNASVSAVEIRRLR